MKKLGGISRRELFERAERGALRPLPSTAYECAEWIERTVNADYHVEVDKHSYSVPCELVHETVWARLTANTVEILHNNGPIASHVRSRVDYKHTTDPAHMPEGHRRHAAGAEGVLAWAATVGPMTVGPMTVGPMTVAMVPIARREPRARAGLALGARASTSWRKVRAGADGARLRTAAAFRRALVQADREHAGARPRERQGTRERTRGTHRHHARERARPGLLPLKKGTEC